jgi:hypothetical protein
VGIAVVVLTVVQPDARRHEPAQEVHHVSGDGFVPILLDHDGGRRALRVHRAEAVAHSAVPHDSPHAIRDVDQFFPPLRREFYDRAHELT